MACFRLPKWTINRIDKIQRDFLWGRSDSSAQAVHLLNWPTVCLPKAVGGLGIPDLELRNEALLLRWWWRLHAEPDSLWSMVIYRLRKKRTYQKGPLLWMVSRSFFWRQLVRIHSTFTWSTQWSIGDGMGISFWFDAWAGLPLAAFGAAQTGLRQPCVSLDDAYQIAHQIAPENEELQNLLLTHSEDRILWKWNTRAEYTAGSAYKVLVTAGKIKWPFMEVWSSKAPPTVKVFRIMLLRDKLLSHEVMERRHMHCDSKCVVCRDCPFETSLYLLFLCPYATHIWFLVSEALGYRLMHQRMTVEEIWHASKSARGGKKKYEWATHFLCTLWAL